MTVHDYTQRRFYGLPVAAEKRADGKQVVRGYAAVFYNPADPNTQYELWQDTFERIMPTAFDAALREKDDVRGLFNHDPSLILGRAAVGTLRLSVDSVGLAYEIDPPDSPNGQNVLAAISRGDVSGSSFAFLVYTGKRGRVVWVEEKQADGRLVAIREIHDLELLDVGPVTYPAYAATTSTVRSAGFVEAIKRERADWLAERTAPPPHEIELLAAAATVLTDRRTP